MNMAEAGHFRWNSPLCAVQVNAQLFWPIRRPRAQWNAFLPKAMLHGPQLKLAFGRLSLSICAGRSGYRKTETGQLVGESRSSRSLRPGPNAKVCGT
jgi:hypothetical protein